MSKPKGRPALSPTRKAVKITITLAPDMAEALDKHENKSQVIREALAAWLRKKGGKP